jgi:hypothetical protein
MSRSPHLRRPSAWVVNARTVLARKGSLTPRKTGAPLRPARHSGRINIATGGSGGMSLEAILFESKPDS